MADITEDDVTTALGAVIDPSQGKSVVELGMVATPLELCETLRDGKFLFAHHRRRAVTASFAAAGPRISGSLHQALPRPAASQHREWLPVLAAVPVRWRRAGGAHINWAKL